MKFQGQTNKLGQECDERASFDNKYKVVSEYGKSNDS